MKTSVALTRLINVASKPNAAPQALAAAALQTITKVLEGRPNGQQALSILRNKFMRQGLDALDGVPIKRSYTKRAVSTSTAVKATAPKRVMSEEARERISKAMTKRWRERRREEAADGTSAKKAKTHKVNRKPSTNVNGVPQVTHSAEQSNA